MSEFTTPMLCQTSLREDLDSEWAGHVAEPKYDGMRCIAVANTGGVKLYGRSGIDYTAHAPHLVKQLEYLLPAGTVIDGELAIISKTVTVAGVTVAVTDFNKTMRIMGSNSPKAVDRQRLLGNIQYLVYDVLEVQNANVMAFPWHSRRKVLQVLDLQHDDIHLSPAFTDPATFGVIFDALVLAGGEGLVCKKASSTYQPGDRSSWHKIKTATTMDMVVSGFTPGKGSFAGQIGAIEFSRWTPDGLVYVARCSGMTHAMRREISENTDRYLGVVVEVKSNDLVGTKEYRTPRHPQFVCFRTDKSPQECLGEELRNY